MTRPIPSFKESQEDSDNKGDGQPDGSNLMRLIGPPAQVIHPRLHLLDVESTQLV